MPLGFVGTKLFFIQLITVNVTKMYAVYLINDCDKCSALCAHSADPGVWPEGDANSVDWIFVLTQSCPHRPE